MEVVQRSQESPGFHFRQSQRRIKDVSEFVSVISYPSGVVHPLNHVVVFSVLGMRKKLLEGRAQEALESGYFLVRLNFSERVTYEEKIACVACNVSEGRATIIDA